MISYEIGPTATKQREGQEMTNEELITKIVSDQVCFIKLQRRYRDNPLAMPSLTQSTRKQQDDEWKEALTRGVHGQIDDRITDQLGS